MNTDNNIAIVIPCFNRTDTLSLLLKSLKNAKYPVNVNLVFSIDYSGNDAVWKMANGFQWDNGEKIIIQHKENIGLRENILSCGDLTDKYDAVIILEDDLLVSPFFLEYAYRALKFYGDDTNIAGISLYSYRISESLREFNPISNGYDTFFMQWTSSWGQMWTKSQWKEFKEWYKLHKDDISQIPIPEYVKGWPHSWKKYHIAYLTDTNKYFVYPTVSFTTIQPTLGVHVSEVRFDKGYIVPLCNGVQRDFIFKEFSEGFAYDCFFEMKKILIEYNGNKVYADLNLYGEKKKENIHCEYFISPKTIPHTEIKKQWGISMIPLETNIIDSVEGSGLYLYEAKSFSPVSLSPMEKVAFRVQLSEMERLCYYIHRLPALFK